MEPHESATPMGPPSRSLREQTQKRQRNYSPVTPSKRRRVQHFPSTVSQRTPASTQISCASTPLSGPRTRAQLDRYFEDVKRDARRIIAVKNQLDVLRELDADPQSSPEPTSGSTPMTTQKAVKLLEKILKDNQLIDDLEEERKEVDPKIRGPKRSDTDGVAKHYRKKQQTGREKLRIDIRKARKRIGYNWGRLKAAGMVTEPEASTAEDTISSSLLYPVVLGAAKGDGDEDSGAMADDSDSEPMLPTGKTIARSIMSPSVPLDHTAEEENRGRNDRDEAETEMSGQNGDADTEASKDSEPVEKQAARKNKTLSKSVQSSLLPFTALMLNHSSIRAPRRSIYTPESVDDEDRHIKTRQEEILTHIATEESSHSAGGPADRMVEETTKPINPGHLETQVNLFPRRSVTPYFLSSVPLFNHDLFSSSDDDISDSGDDEDSSDDDEDDSSDVEVKEEDEVLDVKLDMFGDDIEDDDEDEDESSDVEVKVEMEEEEEVKESSEDTRNEEDKKAEKVTGDNEDQEKERLVGQIPALNLPFMNDLFKCLLKLLL